MSDLLQAIRERVLLADGAMGTQLQAAGLEPGGSGEAWNLDHPDRVAQLVLLNTYYSWMPTLRAPEAIALYSTPVVRTLVRWIVRRWDSLDRRLYMWQVGRFMRDERTRTEMLAQLYPSFRKSREAF